jgi:hypothetical protein
MSNERQSFGVYVERVGIWAIAAIALWFGATVRDLTKEVGALREQLATVIAEKKNDTVRVDRIEKDMTGVKNDVNDLYALHQWSLETFHGAKVPKAFHRKN